MPLTTISKETFDKYSDPLDEAIFWKAVSTYEYVKKNTFHKDIKLISDVSIIFFSTKTIDSIVNSGRELIVARFGCKSKKEQYSGLTVSLCAMNKGEIDEVENFYEGSSDSKLVDVNKVYTKETWLEMEKNYKQRRLLLMRDIPSRFQKEKSHGIAHIQQEFLVEWFDGEVFNGMETVALFLIRYPDYTSIAFVNATEMFKEQLDKDQLDSSEFLAALKIYDQGTGCCPV